jgi:hypothetical protein
MWDLPSRFDDHRKPPLAKGLQVTLLLGAKVTGKLGIGIHPGKQPFPTFGIQPKGSVGFILAKELNEFALSGGAIPRSREFLLKSQPFQVTVGKLQ